MHKGGVIRRESFSGVPAFSFEDLEREAREIIARAQTQAEKIVRAGQQQARQIVEGHRREGHDEGLAQGRREGVAQARQQAREEAVEAAQSELTELKRALVAGLGEFERQKHSLLAVAEAGLIELAVAIARRVCKTRVESSIEPARANARALLEMVQRHGNVELHVNPAEHDLLQSVAAEFLGRVAELEHVTVLADPAVERGGCLLRTREGAIDASITGQIERIANTICAPPDAGLTIDAGSSS